MVQYQSFPDAAGDSLTLEKLKALRLPELRGKRFLDVGCNEGFFCGYASFEGASCSVGIDQSAEFIDRARRRFPQCEFIQGSWEQLPDESFDVILLASALHYAKDQAALVHELIGRLAPDGIFVLELGIAASPNSEWMRVRRGGDERFFPSMPLLQDLLTDYAWKWMGPSVKQDGDPINRHVLHISKPRPMAYLLMQPPGYGKTSIAKSLFERAGVPIVSGDSVIAQVANGDRGASPALHQLLAEDYSPYRLDATIRRVFDRGQGEALVDLWASMAPAGDFALDVYVPEGQHAQVEQTLAARGYWPIILRWDRVAAGLPAAEDLAARAEAFYLSLTGACQEGDASTHIRATGFVDELSLSNGQLVIRGWAVTAKGAVPDRLVVKVCGVVTVVEQPERQLRPDVQRHLGLPHGLVGYRVAVPAQGLGQLAGLRGRFEVADPEGGVFHLAAQLSEQLG